MQKSRSFSLLFLGVALTACGTSVEYVPLNASPRPLTARSPQSVAIYMTSVPDRPYVEIGTIESQQREYSFDGAGDIYEKMREEAGRQGCDGLVILGANDATVVSGHANSIGSKSLKGYRASCIVYTDTR